MNRIKPINALGPIVAILLAVAAPLLLNSIYWTSVLTEIIIYALLAASLRTILMIGEFSLGHAGFMCLGAYSSALLTMKAGLPFGLTLPIAGFMAGLLAFVLGYPFMRTKGIYFGILTIAISESIRLLAYNWKSMTNGDDGLVGFPGAGVLSIPGLGQVDFNGFIEYYYLTLGLVCVSLFILNRLERSKIGFTWLAIRDADKLAGAVGVNVLKYKVIAFSIACFFGGIGGGLFAHFERALGPLPGATFGVMTTIYLLVYVIVGGKDKFAGPIIGTVVLSLVNELTRPVEEYQPMIIGVIAIMILKILPGGILSIPQKIFPGGLNRSDKGD
jgi:branched-chain amino acid transport system permease protein